jgi:hypothetical protein
VGLIAGIVVGALLIGAGGYFAYKKFAAPKDQGTEVAQSQPPAGQDTAATAPVQTPQSPDQASPPPETAVQQAQTPSSQTQSNAYQTPPQGGRQKPVYATPSGASQSARQQAPAQQTPSYTPPPQQQTQTQAPASTPPSRPPAQPVEERQPILRPERSYPPAPVTQTPTQSAAPSATTAARYTGPSSGMLMWSGKLDRNAVVTIDGSSVTTGTLTGSLPGVPVTLETDLTNIGFAEMPSPSNGWKKVSLRSKKSQNIVVNIRWRVID